MKTISLLLFTTVFALHTHAQLNDTKWKTTLQLDQPLDVVFHFHSDTLDVVGNDDSTMSIETMKFSAQDTVVTLQKLYGQSDCDTTVKATYSYKINGNEMSFRLISDDCLHRSDVLKDLKLTKSE